MNKSLNTCNVIWQNLVVLLLSNTMFDATYLLPEIYINFHTFLCKKYDIGSVITDNYLWCNETDDYGLVFIVSISLLRKILNACPN